MPDTRQLALPGIDMRPVCPSCGQPADVLGQYSPLWPYAVCRDCSTRWPYRLNVLEPATESSKRTTHDNGFRIDPTASSADREWRIIVEGRLKDAIRGCKLARGAGLEAKSPTCWHQGHTEPGCRLCERRVVASGAARYMGYLAGIEHQTSLPVCQRCGCASELAGRYGFCQRCHDEMAVESLYRHRAIFGGDDDEAVLDRIYPAHKDLFDRGVLPDYWFRLIAEQKG